MHLHHELLQKSVTQAWPRIWDKGQQPLLSAERLPHPMSPSVALYCLDKIAAAFKCR